MGVLERAFLRRAGRYRIRTDVSTGENGQIDVTFNLPGSPFHRRAIPEPEKHCVMRAFDRMFVQGKSKIGRIGALILYDPLRGGFRCVASFALTNFSRPNGVLRGHRLVLFPSWSYQGHTIAFKNVSGKSVFYDAHHVTFEPNPDGSINCHATSFDRKEPKEVLCGQIADEDGGVLLTQIFIQDHESLDPVGVLRRSFPCNSNPEDKTTEWRDVLQKSFPRRHIVMIPPNLMNRSDRGIVFGRIYLSREESFRKVGEKFPAMVFTELPSVGTTSRLERNWFRIKVVSDLFLYVSLYRIDGTLTQSKPIWAFENG